MPLDPAEQALLDDMKYRELTIKSKKRATDAILFRERRFRAVLDRHRGVVIASIAALILFEILRRLLDQVGWWLPGVWWSRCAHLSALKLEGTFSVRVLAAP